MHSENSKDIQQCADLASQFAEECKKDGNAFEKGFAMQAKFALDHKEPVDKFGRYPSRNEALGRESSPEELEYLKTANRWGQ